MECALDEIDKKIKDFETPSQPLKNNSTTQFLHTNDKKNCSEAQNYLTNSNIEEECFLNTAYGR